MTQRTQTKHPSTASNRNRSAGSYPLVRLNVSCVVKEAVLVVEVLNKLLLVPFEREWPLADVVVVAVVAVADGRLPPKLWHPLEDSG